jgi:hypothetical protein
MKAFIFSTSAIVGKEKVAKDHALLKEKLQSRGYVILDEFSCKGFNTNSFLRFFGGMNKGRPNAEDLTHAEEFAVMLKQKARDVQTSVQLETYQSRTIELSEFSSGDNLMKGMDSADSTTG